MTVKAWSSGNVSRLYLRHAKTNDHKLNFSRVMAQQVNKNTYYTVKNHSLRQIQGGNSDVAVKKQHWQSKLTLHGSSCPTQTTVDSYSWPADEAAAACSEFASVCIRQALSSHTDGPCLLCTTAA